MRRKLFFLFLICLILCSPLHAAYRTCHRFNLPGWWGSAEYMLIWRKKRFFPPLVTTNTMGLPPVLGGPGTEILFGNENLGSRCPKSGARGDIGLWLLPCLGFGVGGFISIRDKIHFFAQGINGVPILGRPFFSFTPPDVGVPSFDPISFPATATTPAISGNIDISAVNRIWSADAYVRYRLLNCGCAKVDLLGGAMVSSVRDTLDIDTFQQAVDVIVIPPFVIPINATLTVNDHFAAKNDFCGGLLGAQAELRTQNWAVQATAKVGVGTMHETVDINGFSIVTLNGITIAAANFGFLTLPSNIGSHKSKPCQFIYEGDIQAQLRIWCNFWASVGYTYMLWPRVQLAGEAVDLNLNFGQLLTPPVGPAVPTFVRHEKRFWAQALTAGLHFIF